MATGIGDFGGRELDVVTCHCWVDGGSDRGLATRRHALRSEAHGHIRRRRIRRAVLARVIASIARIAAATAVIRRAVRVSAGKRLNRRPPRTPQVEFRRCVEQRG